MHLTISPVRGLPGQPETEIIVNGDTITVDGLSYDLSSVPEGGDAQPQGVHPFIGQITRQNGKIVCAVRVTLGDDAQSHQPTDAAHWTLVAQDGPVTIPALRQKGKP